MSKNAPQPPQPLRITVDYDEWDRRLKANEIQALLEFMSRGQLHATEALPFVQLQARLRQLLADEQARKDPLQP